MFSQRFFTSDVQVCLLYQGMAKHSIEPGSYFSSSGESLHNIASGEAEVTVYVRTDGALEVTAQGH